MATLADAGVAASLVKHRHVCGEESGGYIHTYTRTCMQQPLALGHCTQHGSDTIATPPLLQSYSHATTTVHARPPALAPLFIALLHTHRPCIPRRRAALCPVLHRAERPFLTTVTLGAGPEAFAQTCDSVCHQSGLAPRERGVCARHAEPDGTTFPMLCRNSAPLLHTADGKRISAPSAQAANF